MVNINCRARVGNLSGCQMDHVRVSDFNPDNDTILAPAKTVNNFVQIEAFLPPIFKIYRKRV
jgi:hypothetical protein